MSERTLTDATTPKYAVYRRAADVIDWRRIAWEDMRPGDLCLALAVADDRLWGLHVFRVTVAPYRDDQGRLAVKGREFACPLHFDGEGGGVFGLLESPAKWPPRVTARAGREVPAGPIVLTAAEKEQEALKAWMQAHATPEVHP